MLGSELDLLLSHAVKSPYFADMYVNVSLDESLKWKSYHPQVLPIAQSI